MGPEDEKNFIDYITSRDGYLIPQYWKSKQIPILKELKFWRYDQQNEDWIWSIQLLKNDIFPYQNYNSDTWITYLPQFNHYFAHGPAFEFTRSQQKEEGLSHGRIYGGLLSESSFTPPNSNQNSKNKFSIFSLFKKKNSIENNEDYSESYKNLINFYRSCCNYIRKNYRKDKAGFYHGQHSDRMEEEFGVKKLP